MKYIDKLVYKCRNCHKPLSWGQTRCANCGTASLTGIPVWLDRLIGFVLFLVVILLLFAAVSMVLPDLPLPATAAIAVLIGSIKFKVSPGMGVYPRRGYVILDVSNLGTDLDNNETRTFEFKPKRWKKRDPKYKDIWDLLMDGFTPNQGEQLVQLLAHFPEDESAEFIDVGLQETDDTDVMIFGVRSLVRIGNRKAKEILWRLEPKKIGDAMNSQVLSKTDKDTLRTFMQARPDAHKQTIPCGNCLTNLYHHAKTVPVEIKCPKCGNRADIPAVCPLCGDLLKEWQGELRCWTCGWH